MCAPVYLLPLPVPAFVSLAASLQLCLQEYHLTVGSQMYFQSIDPGSSKDQLSVLFTPLPCATIFPL